MRLPAFFLFIGLFCISANQPQQTKDMIFTAVLQGEIDNNVHVLFNVRTVFQGTPDEHIELAVPDDAKIIPGTEYLVTLTYDENLKNIKAAFVPLVEATRQVQDLYYAIHCVDRERKPPGVACQRDLQAVCGCDGKDYGNPCESYRAGVNIYTFGRCKPD